MLTQYMERYRVGFEWTGSTLVLAFVWIWMCHCLIWCTMKPSQLQTRLVFDYNGNDVWLSADVDWIYGTESCWLWTNRKYVVIGACLNLNDVSLLVIRCILTQNEHSLGCNDDDICRRGDVHVDQMCNGIVPALDEQTVRRCWCLFEFECVIAWYTMHYITPPQLHTPLIFNYNGNDLWLCADVDVDWMCATISFGLWMNRQYVVCSKLNVSLLGMIHTRHFNYNGNDIRTALLWCCFNVWNGIALAFDEQAVRWYRCKFIVECAHVLYTVHVWIWMRHHFVYDALYMTPWQLHAQLQW